METVAIFGMGILIWSALNDIKIEIRRHNNLLDEQNRIIDKK